MRTTTHKLLLHPNYFFCLIYFTVLILSELKDHAPFWRQRLQQDTAWKWRHEEKQRILGNLICFPKANPEPPPGFQSEPTPCRQGEGITLERGPRVSRVRGSLCQQPMTTAVRSTRQLFFSGTLASTRKLESLKKTCGYIAEG